MKHEDDKNPRVIPEAVHRRRIQRAREAAAGRPDPGEYQVSEEWLMETASPTAILRGRREVVVPAEKRKQKGKRRIFVERKGNPDTRKLKAKLLR